MAAQAKSSWRLNPGAYLGEISALAFLHHSPTPFPLLLAGTGSHILFYDVSTGDCLSSFLAFHGVRVHGIAVRPAGERADPDDHFRSEIAVFGEKRLNLVRVLVSSDLAVSMELACRLPGFNHWVLDALFLEEGRRLAVGLGDNSVAVWDVARSSLVLRVHSPDRCLLYSMRLWGSNVVSLSIASGTIYNEIIVYNLIARNTLMDEEDPLKFSSSNSMQGRGQWYVLVRLHRLSGHEGSIFRMAWSSDGAKLISASDDRSTRIWKISRRHDVLHEAPEPHVSEAHLTLYGHDARIWDCYISDSIFITVGEDCTCRMWNTEGYQLMMIRDHNGRGIWRCLYDQETSLLITAGFDSAIKVHVLPASSLGISKAENKVLGDLKDKEELFSFYAPKAAELLSLLDSKSEYIRCLHFSQEDILYVGTNNGILYNVQLIPHSDAKWTQVARVSEKGPIICLDLMTLSSSADAAQREDMIAIGDGKGSATVLRVTNHVSRSSLAACTSWVAERERQLLGVYWCKSLGCSHIFTANPRGTLKMWRVADSLHLATKGNKVEAEASLVAIFQSVFGTRIVCLDATYAEELVVLGCGDQRGNISIFVFSNMLLSFPNGDVREIAPVTHFKGAHGISTVATLSMATLKSNEVKICTTGGDGCICYFEFSCISNVLEFMGMKQVKGLNLVKVVIGASSSDRDLLYYKYAAGFTSADFIVWDMADEMKIRQVSCGGWRRPYSYYFGDYPDIQNCFAFVKDHTIHVHRIWLPSSGKKIHSKIIHMQFHGREVHTLCFISFGLPKGSFQDNGLWLATGCEDGTVRLTRYAKPRVDAWTCSQLLGEHVGGSAVKSVCFISKIYALSRVLSYEGNGNVNSCKSHEDQFLLISVGAKQVLTLWLLHYKPTSERETEATMSDKITSKFPSIPYMSFQWLSTHIPPRTSNALLRRNDFQKYNQAGNVSLERPAHLATSCLGGEMGNDNLSSVHNYENDWRYMAVTAFIVRTADLRSSVCFVVVAGSDGTVVLRAFVLPHRLWFDVGLLVSNASPILTLRHVVFPLIGKSEDDGQMEHAFIVIGGSTCGAITFWDLTDSVWHFLKSLMIIPLENIDWQKRPRTGRGSQGGRRWKLSPCILERKNNGGPKMDSFEKGDENKHTKTSIEGEKIIESFKPEDSQTDSMDTKENNFHMNGVQCKLLATGTDEVHPLLVLDSSHQSGVNCLHVTEKVESSSSDISYCLLSGGDDQSLHFLVFDLELQATSSNSIQNKSDDIGSREKCSASIVNHRKIRKLYSSKIISAHNSAVKGVWTDGIWAFSTGLDQRIRCWRINDHSKLVEYGHLIISVPEPESLDVVASTRNHYQIAVAGRGMQMVEFITDAEDD